MVSRVGIRRLIARFTLAMLAGVAAGATTHQVEHAAQLVEVSRDHPAQAHFDPSPRADLHPCTVCNWSGRHWLPQEPGSQWLLGSPLDVVVFGPAEVPISVVDSGASPRAPPLFPS